MIARAVAAVPARNCSRRGLLAALPALACARAVLLAAGAPRARFGLCSFSCHQHWKAAAADHAGAQFQDAPGFLDYARRLGAEGVQTSLRGRDPAMARRIREVVEATGAYYEGELRLPRSEADVDGFATDVRLSREAGAKVARAVFTGGRRYEQFRSLAEFQEFRDGAERSLALAAPVLQRHRLQLAMENHKDFTTEELLALMQRFASEWIGVLVDTGNNLALLEEPHAVIEALAPLARSVHLKDMALQPHPSGFRLSEVPLGTGLLDLPRVVATLRRAHPSLVFNLEMATRDPLVVPCQTEPYWVTFPERRSTHLRAALARVAANPPRQPPPMVTGRSLEEILIEEEAHNRHGLAWMKTHLSA